MKKILKSFKKIKNNYLMFLILLGIIFTSSCKIEEIIPVITPTEKTNTLHKIYLTTNLKTNLELKTNKFNTVLSFDSTFTREVYLDFDSTLIYTDTTVFNDTSSLFFKALKTLMIRPDTIRDSILIEKPSRVFNQLISQTYAVLEWEAKPDSTMNVFIVFGFDQFNNPAYILKKVPYPDSILYISNDMIPLKNKYNLISFYLIAEDKANNQSASSDTVRKVIAKELEIWGNVTGDSLFDEIDYGIMQFFIKQNEYKPEFDFNSDGKLDSLDSRMLND